QRAKTPKGQKQDRCANLKARPPHQNHSMPAVSPAPPTVSPIRLQHLSAAGEGAFTQTGKRLQQENDKEPSFLRTIYSSN
ncbi:hypothetical protein ACFORG_04555, partial [Lutimaribacter marinistellae]